MQAISFCLNGKMAHFRKYYSNSTALSHLVPPAVTVKGIIAGLLGYERDTYYELMSNNRCKLSINVKSPVKKITQTVNLIKVESLSQLNGAGAFRTQNHTEFVVPKEIRGQSLCYEVVFFHEDEELMKTLGELLCHPIPAYFSQAISLSLGSAQCLGWISSAHFIELTQMQSNGGIVEIDSAVVLERIAKICLGAEGEMNFFKEETITEFDAKRQITAGAKKEILLNLDDVPLRVQLKEDALYFCNNGRNIMFLE